MKHILCLLLAAAGLIAADATGTWTGTLTPTGPGTGGESHPALLVLKQDGAKLTGTAGPNAEEQNPIENGKAENGKLTFEVQAGGGMKFNLTHEGDEIKGDISRERDGQTQTAKLAVKRQKESK
jgi:hypothetical protein